MPSLVEISPVVKTKNVRNSRSQQQRRTATTDNGKLSACLLEVSPLVVGVRAGGMKLGQPK